MTNIILRVENLNKSFGALTTTDDVSFDVKQGEIHTLIGPNGAGKSTLIAQITGWLKSDSGTVWLGEHNISNLSVAKRSRLGLGRSFQVSCLAMELSARRNVMLAIQAQQGSSFRFWKAISTDKTLIEEANNILHQLNIADYAEIKTSELSHGKRRELEVACALALKPKILLLDEPMAGLDPASTKGLIRLLEALKNRIPILLIEHDMDAVFQLSNRISVLLYGKIVFSGTPDEVKSSSVVREAYLGTT